MRIYYNIEPSQDPRLDFIQETFFEMLRYKTMWALRSIEQEITDANGAIIIHFQDGETRVECKDFTAEMTELIESTLKLEYECRH